MAWLAGAGMTVLGALATPAFAAPGNASGKVVIVSSLSFLSVEELEFGNILPSVAAGTVVVSPANVRTRTGGVTLVGGLVQPARFAGRGSFNQIVQISLGAPNFTLTRSGGGGTMQLDTIVIGSTPTAVLTPVPRTFRIASPTGIFNFPIGGTLRVKANQAPGDYSGTITLTLNYL
jgi:Domain of unknown function (DUF4402)